MLCGLNCRRTSTPVDIEKTAEAQGEACVKPIREKTQAELSAHIQSHLREKGVDVVRYGGALVVTYLQGGYVSGDLDFVNRYAIPRGTIISAVEDQGFQEVGRHFMHLETAFFVAFPLGPLAIVEAYTLELTEMKLETGKLVLITPTECVKDRLAWHIHAGDNQSLLHALLVARDHSVDLDEIKKWSQGEGKSEEPKDFLEQLNKGD
jgi:hypothetical protein